MPSQVWQGVTAHVALQCQGRLPTSVASTDCPTPALAGLKRLVMTLLQSLPLLFDVLMLLAWIFAGVPATCSQNTCMVDPCHSASIYIALFAGLHLGFVSPCQQPFSHGPCQGHGLARYWNSPPFLFMRQPVIAVLALRARMPLETTELPHMPHKGLPAAYLGLSP